MEVHLLVDYVLFVLFLISVPIYVIILLEIYRFRNKEPFNTGYFKIAFSLGVFDVTHLLGNWCLGKFSNWGWLGVSKLVMMRPSFFAKASSVLWWYTAYGQKLGVFFTAFNRMTVIGFDYQWTPLRMGVKLACHWLIPLVLVAPQLALEFNYHPINGTDGVVMYWENVEWQWLVFNYCLYYCFGLAGLCALCYLVTVIKIHQSTSTNRINNAEIRLAIVGVILTIITAICGLYCWLMADVRDPKVWERMLPYQNILFDVYAWINPYLLIICSRAVRMHLKPLLTNQTVVHPIASTHNKQGACFYKPNTIGLKGVRSGMSTPQRQGED